MKNKITELEFAIADSISIMNNVIPKARNPIISYSGGADSDCMIHLVNKLNNFDLPAVFFDTGIEYRATMEHLKEQQEKYDITIVKPEKPIPIAVKEYGQPFINKYASALLAGLQRHNFDFKNDGHKNYNELYNKYGIKSALMWWCNENKSDLYNIRRNKLLKEFLIKYGLPFRVSAKCCEKVKKRPGKMYLRKINSNLALLGMRRSEGGIRRSLKSCITKANTSRHYDIYNPMFWWSNDVRDQYQARYNIVFSKCYTKYEFSRTGCAGCPFSLNMQDNPLKKIKTYEPKLYKAVCNIFNDAYKWNDLYNEFIYKNDDSSKQISLNMDI